MRRARNIFWIIFFISILILIVLAYTGPLIASILENLVHAYPGPGQDGSMTTSAVITAWIPFITAVGSLIGAVTTSIITLRRDRLEVRKTELELVKMQLELTKLQKDTEIELAKKQRELEELQEKDQGGKDKQNI